MAKRWQCWFCDVWNTKKRDPERCHCCQKKR